MLVKFLARGTGAARDATGYLLGERDAAGKPRDGVEVLRGDPHQVAAVADTLPFEHKYTSGVIAWAPEDQPTDEQIGAVLDAFEKTAWAGLDFDRYAWTAVLHRERGGGAHVHVLAARCDLETGRSLNIAPPGWEKTFGPLRDAFNAEHGWARPDDPARARVQQPGHRAYIDATRLRAGLRLESSPRDLIRDYLLQRVEHGTVRNRHEVVDALREIEPVREVFTVTLDTPGSDAGYGLGAVAAASVTIEEGVCDRTPQVGDEIVQQAGVGGCVPVEDRHLASIHGLEPVLSEGRVAGVRTR